MPNYIHVPENEAPEYNGNDIGKPRMYVSDINGANENIMWLDNSQAVVSYLSYFFSGKQLAFYKSVYDGLFVELIDGEIESIWACESNIPYMHYSLDTLVENGAPCEPADGFDWYEEEEETEG